MRVIAEFERFFELTIDPDFLELLPHLHGGIPKRQHFRDSKERQHRIGRFLFFVDSATELTGPARPTRENDTWTDERVFDLGVPYVCGQWLSRDAHPEIGDNEFNFFFNASRFFPFAVLHTTTRRGLSLIHI